MITKRLACVPYVSERHWGIVREDIVLLSDATVNSR